MKNENLKDAWDIIVNNLKEQGQVSEPACNQWIIPLTPLSLDDEVLELGTMNELHKEWVEKYHIPFIRDAAAAYIGKPIEIKLTDLKKSSDVTYTPYAVEQTDLFASENVMHVSEALDKKYDVPEKIAPGDVSTLNPRYTFDTFVTGNSNKFAHAASLAIAESPGTVYNPFFIYGGVGLGKTHLMHAIGNEIIKTSPDMRVLYISSERFTNELINSIRNGTTEEFRQKYRKIDVLMVDDIQFLYKKTGTQEEFFHTFNALYLEKKQIIISSDRPPKEIETLEDRLRSRFESGLITDIQAPDLETRVAILKKKATLENISVPTDALFYIAGRIDNNIRELEGALTRVVAYASLENMPITTELVAESLSKLYPSDAGVNNITIELIKEVVASFFKINAEDLDAKKRTKELVYPRQIAMYICRELTDLSLPNIGDEFGGRDHTTVLHAYEKISKDRKEDAKLDSTIKDLIARLRKM